MNNKHSTWVGFVGGFGLAIAGAAFPALFPSVPQSIALLLFWGGLVVGSGSFVALLLMTNATRRGQERVALNSFLYAAELRGWIFKGGGHDALKLLDMMAQAMADSAFVAWGRKLDLNVLVEIPANEWTVLRIDLPSGFNCGRNGEILGVHPDNAATACFESGTAFTVKYRDLHVSEAALAWLRALK